MQQNLVVTFRWYPRRYQASMHAHSDEPPYYPHRRQQVYIISSVLNVCVVSYNKLRWRANATKLGSKLLTISKKVLARQRMLVLTSHRLSPQTATSIHHLSQSSTYVLSAIINYTVVPSQQNLVETFRWYPRRTRASTHARSDGSHCPISQRC